MLQKKFVIIILLVFIFTACEDDRRVSFSDINISTENNTLVDVNIIVASGNSNAATNINSEIEKIILQALNIGNPDTITSKSIEESINNFNNEYQSFKINFPDTVAEWEAQIDGEIMFQSPEIISIAITSYNFTGGAHGSLNISLLNFNATTGNIIENKNLFKNIEEFKALAKTYFYNALEDKNTLFEATKFQLPENIAYSDEGLILLYNTYEIAPYSTGIIEFKMPYNAIESYLVFNGF